MPRVRLAAYLETRGLLRAFLISPMPFVSPPRIAIAPLPSRAGFFAFRLLGIFLVFPPPSPFFHCFFLSNRSRWPAFENRFISSLPVCATAACFHAGMRIGPKKGRCLAANGLGKKAPPWKGEGKTRRLLFFFLETRRARFTRRRAQSRNPVFAGG